MNCKNCGTDIALKFCPNCGQPAVLKRIDAHYITHEIEHVLHFERGILYTVKELIVTPGQNVRKYISENRSRLVKPIIFIIVTSLIYSVITHFFHLEDKYVLYNESKPSTTGALFSWLQSHYGYANIIMGVFIAFWTKLFFKKYDYNFFEILILLCFVMGMGMLIYALFSIIQVIVNMRVANIGGIIGIVYCSWAIGQFFDSKKVANYLKALAAYILGLLTFSVVMLVLGSTIDYLIK
ncbi:DUF3667 domain-containing protein [Sphingobacterium sp.]|uniref:DUF3667 domain-containing protein n=1 Tax=Sphingobacterium sp. TaxID=341027 RepID=UPI00289ED811|nr:DUF3667 domain-containing protein [Sphingobacterium sp.]